MSSSCLREFRCPHCDKLLFKGILVDAQIEVKCRACHKVIDTSSWTHQNLVCMVDPCPHRIFPPSTP